jgi:hypothetical protein
MTPFIVLAARIALGDAAEVRPRALMTYGLSSLGTVILWLMWCAQRLQIVDSPWWQYDFRPTSLVAAFMFYVFTLFNFALGSVVLADPCVKASAFPYLGVAARAPFEQLFGFLWIPLAVVGMRSRYGTLWRAASFGMLWSALAAAPCLPLSDRWLLYYAYPTHAGIALTLSALLVILWDAACRSAAGSAAPSAPAV